VSQGMPSPAELPLRQRKKDRTRRQMLSAALELFEQQGYENTSVEQIAARAETSPATFFRYFASKDEVLFLDEQQSAADLASAVAARADSTADVAALADPIVEYAQRAAGRSENGARRMRIIMATPSLETRSLRMRLLWERALAHQLAQEAGQATPSFEQNVVASLAVSCYVTALREWPGVTTPRRATTSIERLTRRALDVAICTGPKSATRTTAKGS
jgi:TetR/AcrR family transcriptional regulator, regulator of mycofactocin system